MTYIVTCGLTACTPGPAPGPTPGNEYGKPLPILLCLVGLRLVLENYLQLINEMLVIKIPRMVQSELVYELV